MNRFNDPLLIWTQLSAGVYIAVGGRFKISRRGPGNWILIDESTGQEMRFGLLRDAQSRAEWMVEQTQ
jgi:hypothetical protein